MINKCIISFLAIGMIVFVSADEDVIELGHLFDNDITAWYETSFRCSELVPYFYEQGEQDSLMYILQYWEQETYIMEPIRRVWTLNQIAINEFKADYINITTIDDVIDYLINLENQKSDSTHWAIRAQPHSQNNPYYLNGTFNTFTIQLANELLRYTDLSDDEYLICLFFSHQFDEFWRLIKNDQARYTTLAATVKKFRKEQEMFDIHYGFSLGYYSPRKAFSLFGEKANFGGTIGLTWQRIIFDASLIFQFLRSQNPYSVIYEHEKFQTRHYFRFNFGLEPGFQLYDWGHTKVNLLSGVGIDVVEAVPEGDNPYYEESISISGLNLNLGIGFQHFIKKGVPWCIHYQIRYEFSGYDTNGGTDLADGEAFSVRLGLSWDANKRKHQFKKYFD